MDKRVKIDAIDAKILRALLIDVRTSLTSIANDCNISVTAVRKRIEKLKKEGIITGKRVILGSKLKKFQITAVITLNSEYAHLSENVQSIKENFESKDYLISGCYRSTGKHDIILGVFLKNKEALDRIVWRIEKLPGIKSLNVFIWLGEIKISHENLFFESKGV
jgi:Lrp/AsnC family leucine-responsive transcriptional regulator